MSNTKQMLKDALVDAKTVRETALAQAKLALEEAFTPQLQSMLAAKLQEMEEEDDVKEEVTEAADDQMEETLDLEALLAEDSVEEAKEEGEEAEEEAEEAPEKGEEKEGEDEEDKDITEMTPEEVEEYIRTIAAEEFAKLETEQGEEIPGAEGEEVDLGDELEDNAAEDGEINIDEMMDEMYGNKEEEEIDENDLNIDELLAEFGLSEEEEINEGEVNEADIDVNALMSALAGAGGVMGVGAGLSMLFDKAMAGKLGTAAKAAAEKISGNNPDRVKMEEALETVEQLRATIQEVNLLNAKLLYMNKVFKGTNLTESQKIDVVKTFDKAESAKEAKLVYESMITTFTKKAETKSAIKESVGFASKAVGMITNSGAKVIETDAQYSRWEKLAFGK